MSSDEFDSGVTPTGPMSSVGRDVRAVQANSAATARELRDFLSQMKGKSPKEMLGVVAQSNLFKSAISATVFMVAVILVFTVIPFGLNQWSGNEQDQAAVAAPDEPQTVEESTLRLNENTIGEKEVLPPGNDIVPSEASLEDRLGIGDALDAPADINPLENAGDDLFKDLE